MSIKKINRVKHFQAGMTLVELMVSIVLGLLLLLAATAMTAKSMVMNGDTLKSVKLNQDLDSVIQVMVNDIRRAGFTGGVFDYADNEDVNIVSSSCVLYSYDLNQNGSVASTERFGFKLVGDEIWLRTQCSGGSCPTSCSVGSWAPLTDNARISITNLAFDSLDSKCLSITAKANITSTNTNNYWKTTTDGTLQFPCMATSGTGLTTYVMDSNSVYGTGTFVAPATGDRLIGARQVNVEIDGQLTNDSTMLKSQRVGIKVRNDQVRVIP